MSLFGSMIAGVAALNAQSQSLGVISNNIANVNTTGYKKNNTQFSDLVTQNSLSAAYTPGGVRAFRQSTADQQGQLLQTSSATDLAVSGKGFFVVQQQPTGIQEPLYTRAGSFSTDQNGYLKNLSGYYLMGWPINPTTGALPAGAGNLNSLQSVNVNVLPALVRTTTSATLSANLDAGQLSTAPAPQFQRSLQVFDSLGNGQNLTFQFTKTATPNQWTLQVNGPANAGWPATHTLDFTTGGGLSTIDGVATTSLTLPAADWANGSDPTQTIDLDLTNITQYASPYAVSFEDQNGVAYGQRTSVEVDENGYVSANFSNGLSQKIYKLPLASFSDPLSLDQRTGNVFGQTINSGTLVLGDAGVNGTGSVSPSTLEGSNVDLADEFTKMITTQRAYSAGTKVITTTDQMLTELLQLR
ncbi:MAG: flagellar hook protein FlgE [Alphaproteobacteria bacterium]